MTKNRITELITLINAPRWKFWINKDKASLELTNYGDQAIPYLIDSLDNTGARHAAYALANMGKSATPALMQALKGPKPVAIWASEVLSKSADVGVVNHLIEALKDERTLRIAALALGGREPCMPTIRGLIEALGHTNRNVRMGAGMAFIYMSHEFDDADIVMPLLSALFTEQNTAIRKGIIITLVGIKNHHKKDILEALRRACQDKDAEVQKAAITALKNIESNR